MISKVKFIDTLVSFIGIKLDEITLNMPILGLFRPVVAEMVNNNINKLDKVLTLISDDNGMINSDKILSEMLDNLIVMPIQQYPDIFGGISLGKGTITIKIPFIDKAIEFNSNDIESFKNLLNKN